MRWTDRQRAMLREMGIALWTPPSSEPTSPDAGVDERAARPRDAPTSAREPAQRRGADTAVAAPVVADTPLGGLRGRIHEHRGVPVIVTFSLAFLLRHPAEKAKAWADLCLAVGGLAEPAR